MRTTCLATVIALGLTTALHAQTGGSDACSTAQVIAGTGQFIFDNTLATVGAEGQTTINCNFYGQNGVDRDVWYLWTAPQTGRVLLSTCGLTNVDTKIAVYDGATCPVAFTTAVACNDDVTSSGVGNLQSFVEFDVVAGSPYLVQLGTYPLAAAGGTGNFDVHYVSGVVCQYDDATTDYASQIGAGPAPHTSCWMYSMGEIGATTLVTTISSAWGWTNTGTPLQGSLTANVGIWNDPTDDGLPNDAVLLATASAPLVGAHTDVLQAIALPAPVTVSGKFFVGAWVETTVGFPVPRDIGGCNSRPFVGWLAGNSTGPFDPVNLSANTDPPFNAPNGQTYVFLLRADCQPAPVGTVFCTGDGVAPHMSCPCGNSSAVADGSGCLNSLGSGGKLRSMGFPSLSADALVLQGTQMPNSTCLYFQGTAQSGAGNGAVFGDGLRCAGGTVVRLGATTNVGGASTYPFGAAPPVHVKGNVMLPGTRTYQGWYRNAAAFCTPSTFNLTNGLEILWTL